MLGHYTNIRLNENEQKILWQNTNDYYWYCVVLTALFNDTRLFEPREDIKIPENSEDDDGIVIIFETGDIVYFKTLLSPNNETLKSVTNACTYLEKLFEQPVDAYIACSSDFEINLVAIDVLDNRMQFARISGAEEGENLIDELESKLRNNEPYTVEDSIKHILLPFMTFKNKEIFQEKYDHYMELVNSYNDN